MNNNIQQNIINSFGGNSWKKPKTITFDLILDGRLTYLYGHKIGREFLVEVNTKNPFVRMVPVLTIDQNSYLLAYNKISIINKFGKTLHTKPIDELNTQFKNNSLINTKMKYLYALTSSIWNHIALPSILINHNIYQQQKNEDKLLLTFPANYPSFLVNHEITYDRFAGRLKSIEIFKNKNNKHTSMFSLETKKVCHHGNISIPSHLTFNKHFWLYRKLRIKLFNYEILNISTFNN